MKKILYLMLALLCACNNPSNNIIHKAKETYSTIALVDTFKVDYKLAKANSITEAAFNPFYIGRSEELVYVKYWPAELENRVPGWDRNKNPDATDLDIFVDTTQTIGSMHFNEKGVIKSYPVFVKNLSKDTLNIGYGDFIPLIMEVKDSLGKWKPIQKPFTYFCGTGLTDFYLPAEQLLITSCKLFAGNYRAKMRLAFGYDGKIKSNEFMGQINYKQFNKPNAD